MTAEGQEPGRSSLAASASQRVQGILEAAEASAVEIRREAEAEAESIRKGARADADRASSSIQTTLRRLEELHGELGTLIGALREEAGAPAPAGGSAPHVPLPPRASPPKPPVPGPPAPEPPVPEPPVPAAAPEPPPAPDDGAGIRLIALNMALDGAPREQTARYLAENFSLEDPARLLDEVYASAGR
jgi:hypothetical protein